MRNSCQRSGAVAAALAAFGDEKRRVAETVFRLAYQFAGRTGGMTAESWSVLPVWLKWFGRRSCRTACRNRRGVSEIRRQRDPALYRIRKLDAAAPRSAFNEWHYVEAEKVGAHGNAVLIRVFPHLAVDLCEAFGNIIIAAKRQFRRRGGKDPVADR